LNPTVSTTNVSLTLDVARTIAAPTVSNFWKSVSYSSSSLPAELSLNSSTGVISGTPTEAGVTSVTITATNSTMFTRTSTFSITVVDPNAPPPPPPTPPTPPSSGGAPTASSQPIESDPSPISQDLERLPIDESDSPELAATGVDVSGVGQLSIFALAVGAALALVARRFARRQIFSRRS
jgi:hypothetical protein